jgi:O-antigen ligase
VHWVLGGYLWLYIHRPFEVWPALGNLQVERLYMIGTLLCWLFYPGKGFVSNRLHVAFVFFAIALMLCWLVSPYSDDGTKTVEDFFKVAVFYVLLVTTVRDERTLRLMLLIYLAAVGLYMAHSFAEFLHGRHVFRMGIRRLIGVDATYNDPNTFSATLLYSLPLTLPFFAEKPRGKLRIALFAYVGLSLVCMLLTGSRGALVGLGCLALMLLWVSRRRGLLVVLLVVAVPIGWSLLPEDLHNRFLTLIDPSVGPANAQASAEGRTQGIVDGINLWSRSPVTGFGPNSFGKAAGHGFQAHNLYGQALGELGSLGAVALLGMLLAFALNAREVRRLSRAHGWQDDFPVRLSGAISLSVLLMLIMGIGSHNLYRYTWMWFGAFQGIALHCLRLRARYQTDARTRELMDVEMTRHEDEIKWQPPQPSLSPEWGRG